MFFEVLCEIQRHLNQKHYIKIIKIIANIIFESYSGGGKNEYTSKNEFKSCPQCTNI